MLGKWGFVGESGGDVRVYQARRGYTLSGFTHKSTLLIIILLTLVRTYCKMAVDG